MDGLSVIYDTSGMEALMRDYPRASEDARTARVTEAILLMEREVKKDTPWGAGPIHLRDSIFSEVRHEGQSTAGILGTPMEHGQPVEYGTKPHFPPIDPLEFWVEKRLGLSGKAARSVAYAIAVSISRKGTKGRKMFSDNFEEYREQVMNILGRIGPDIKAAVEGL